MDAWLVCRSLAAAICVPRRCTASQTSCWRAVGALALMTVTGPAPCASSDRGGASVQVPSGFFTRDMPLPPGVACSVGSAGHRLQHAHRAHAPSWGADKGAGHSRRRTSVRHWRRGRTTIRGHPSGTSQWSQGHASLRVHQPLFRDSHVLRFPLDAHPGKTFLLAGQPGGAAAEEWVEYGAAGEANEPDEVAHQLEGLDGGMAVDPCSYAFLASRQVILGPAPDATVKPFLQPARYERLAVAPAGLRDEEEP